MPAKSTLEEKALAFIASEGLPVEPGPNVVDRLTAYVRENYGGMDPLRLSWQARLRAAGVGFATPRAKRTMEKRAAEFIRKYQLPVDPDRPDVVARLSEYVWLHYPDKHRIRDNWNAIRKNNLPPEQKRYVKGVVKPRGRPRVASFDEAVRDFVVRRNLPLSAVAEKIVAEVESYVASLPRTHTTRSAWGQLRRRWADRDAAAAVESPMVRKAMRFARRHKLPVSMEPSEVVAAVSAYVISLPAYHVLKNRWAEVARDGLTAKQGRRRRPSHADEVLAAFGFVSGQRVLEADAQPLVDWLTEHWITTFPQRMGGGSFWKRLAGAGWAVQVAEAGEGQVVLSAVRLSGTRQEQVCDVPNSVTENVTDARSSEGRNGRKAVQRGQQVNPDLQLAS